MTFVRQTPKPNLKGYVREIQLGLQINVERMLSLGHRDEILKFEWKETKKIIIKNVYFRLESKR